MTTTQAEPTTESAAIVKLQEALNTLDLESSEALSLEDAIKLLVAVNRHRDQTKMIYEELSKKVSDLMGTLSEFHAPDGITVEKRWSKSRTGWRHADLAKEVAHRIESLSFDPDTGEVTLTREESIVALLEYLAPSYWRVGALRSISLEPDDWCEAGEAKPPIVVRNARG